MISYDPEVYTYVLEADVILHFNQFMAVLGVEEKAISLVVEVGRRLAVLRAENEAVSFQGKLSSFVIDVQHSRPTVLRLEPDVIVATKLLSIEEFDSDIILITIHSVLPDHFAKLVWEKWEVLKFCIFGSSLSVLTEE